MPIRTLVNQNQSLVPVLKIGTASGLVLALGSTATNTATTGLGCGVVILSSDISFNFKFHNSATETFAASQDHRLPANSTVSFDISDMGSQVFLSARGTTATAVGVLGTLWISRAL
jgi:hypothetical protein